MTMFARLTAGAALIALASCAEDKPAPAAPEVPATLPAGLYQVDSEVTQLRSADKTTPATRMKLGDKTTMQACVAADGAPDMAMFVDAGDKCEVTNSYTRSGRISVQYQCSRKGRGSLYSAADGKYSADGFEALVNMSTSFSGAGDYQVTRRVTARRTGDCPPGGAPKA